MTGRPWDMPLSEKTWIECANRALGKIAARHPGCEPLPVATSAHFAIYGDVDPITAAPMIILAENHAREVRINTERASIFGGRP